MRADSDEDRRWRQEFIGKREETADGGEFPGHGEAVGGEIALPAEGSNGAARRLRRIRTLAAIGRQEKRLIPVCPAQDAVEYARLARSFAASQAGNEEDASGRWKDRARGRKPRIQGEAADRIAARLA